MSQELRNQDCMNDLRAILEKLRDAKPDDRSELARRYQVTITELEKVLAYFWTYVVTGDDQ